MQSFIRVIEVWTPTESGQELQFENGIYGPLKDFAEYSKKEKFAIGEGLPGSAWEKACPVVLKHFDESNFLRTQSAHEVGLTSAVAIPVFAGEQLKAVLVFLCGDEKKPSGAIEVWADDGLSGLALIDGYYGDLDRFEWLSKRVKFPRGVGLPGLVWKTASPLIADITDSNAFLRSKEAANEGITVGLAIPINTNTGINDIGSVITFLSSKSTPIAKRFEIWKPDEDGNCLYFEAGIMKDNPAIEPADTSFCVEKGKGVIGQTWLSGVPGMTTDLTLEPLSKEVFRDYKKYSSLLAIPVYFQQNLTAVVAFYN